MHYGLPNFNKSDSTNNSPSWNDKKKKWKKPRDLREMKKKLRAFQLIEIDTKDLSDIERYWPQMYTLKLPRYQFSARDVRTGGGWISYGETKDGTNAGIFAEYLLLQLKHYGGELSEVMIQIDNGCEFIGSVQKRKGKSAFIKV